MTNFHHKSVSQGGQGSVFNSDPAVEILRSNIVQLDDFQNSGLDDDLNDYRNNLMLQQRNTEGPLKIVLKSNLM